MRSAASCATAGRSCRSAPIATKARWHWCAPWVEAGNDQHPDHQPRAQHARFLGCCAHLRGAESGALECSGGPRADPPAAFPPPPRSHVPLPGRGIPGHPRAIHDSGRLRGPAHRGACDGGDSRRNPALAGVDVQRRRHARSPRCHRPRHGQRRGQIHGAGVLDSRLLGAGAPRDSLPHVRRSHRKECQMGKLTGKVAVITGGNSGIGLATAKEFAEQGAQVVIAGRDQKTLVEAAREIGRDVLAVRADVAKLDDIDQLFAQVRAKYGRVDVLFVNAGVGKFVPLEAVTEQLYDSIIDVNLKGAFFTIQKALPLLADGASIVLNTSISAHIGRPIGTSVYSASKAALLSLARTLSAELVDRNIRVNAVSPGPVTTPIFSRLGIPAEALEETRRSIESQVPMKRFGRPEEIAKAALFLASADSSFLLGSEIVADGGMSQL